MKIVVLMSTYNGEKYVLAQLESILDQLPDDGEILIRDDGSSDSTLSLIQQVGDPRITVIRGTNIGFCRSFFALIDAAPAEADILFFSDQDDVWLRNKVERVVSSIGAIIDRPAIYCGRMMLVDAELNQLGLSSRYPRGPSFESALAENIVTGCAAAFNRRARALISQRGNIDQIGFHDWWAYLVVSAFGIVVVDDTPTVLYRQHGANVIGMGRGWRRAASVLRFLMKQDWVRIMYSQAENFRRIHGPSLAAHQLKYVDRYFNRTKRQAVLRLVLAPRRFRQTLVDDVLLRFLVVYSTARNSIGGGDSVGDSGQP